MRYPFSRPTLLLDEDRCRKNLKEMIRKAENNRLLFRPHFKTHQAISIGKWFIKEGVKDITCSSVAMAEYFADEGYESITIAFPINILEIDRVNVLSDKVELNVLVESIEVVDFLSEHLQKPLKIWIKIDVGTERTGINSRDIEHIKNIQQKILDSKCLDFAGILSHAGHSYDCRSHSEIIDVNTASLSIMSGIREQLDSPCLISTGDTPTCSVAQSFPHADEIRPGNFIFYDLMQVQISSCTADKIAVSLCCPIVAKHADRKELLIHGGGIHFGKDHLIDQDGNVTFGYVVDGPGLSWNADKFRGSLVKISQEHGSVKIKDEFWDNYKIGDMIKILPVHSCMTVHTMREFFNIQTCEFISTLNS